MTRRQQELRDAQKRKTFKKVAIVAAMLVLVTIFCAFATGCSNSPPDTLSREARTEAWLNSPLPAIPEWAKKPVKPVEIGMTGNFRYVAALEDVPSLSIGLSLVEREYDGELFVAVTTKPYRVGSLVKVSSMNYQKNLATDVWIIYIEGEVGGD